MNANELADYWLERKLVIDMAEETASILLQQQTELDKAKKENLELRGQTLGLMTYIARLKDELENTQDYVNKQVEKAILKLKKKIYSNEITFKDINDLCKNMFNDRQATKAEIALCRAILKKAQEK